MNSAADVWSKVQNILSADLTETAITTWFDDCRAVEITDNRLFLHTPSEFKKGVIETRFIGTLRSALNELFSGEFDVIILDDDGLKALTETPKEPDYLYIDEYTFENFVVGNSNKLAHAAAIAVSEGRQKQVFNPLFIYGDSGLGKTHLLYAIKHFVATKFPALNIVHVKGDDLTNELVAAIRQGKNFEFRDKYRNADYFLVDDIQFIAGRIETQNEFFNTFNALYEAGRQIVFTSDKPPSEMLKLEDRLKSRFEQGQLADIAPPDDALRLAIIMNKAEKLGVILPDDVTYYIAENLTSNVRQLEGAVKMLIAYRDIMDDEITVEAVKKRLKDIFKGERDLIPTTDTIIEETAKYFLLTPEEVKGQSRISNTALARQIAMYLIRKLTNLSLKETAGIFDGRDHTTALTSTRKIERKIRDEQDFSKVIRDITSNINSKT